MAENSLFVEVLTPDKSHFAGFAKAVYFPGEGGYLGVLPGHAPLLTRLGVGVITCVEENGDEVRIFCSGGFAEVMGRDVSILATVAERETEIDTVRAEMAKERAEKRLFSASPQVDYARAMGALQRALERLRITHNL
jgi:F-type H+-transporting ATPase subunit epsilon